MKRNYKGQPPNPLFEKWLKEMKEQAAANDSPLQYGFGKALASLQKCPIRLETGKDCLVLQNFGKKICEILDKKLQEYKKTNNLPSSSRPSTIHEILGDDEDEDNGVGGKRAKKGKAPDDRVPDEVGRPVYKVTRNRLYMPKVGSGAHAILTTMYNSMQEPNYPGYMLRKDIISKSQKHCESPMKNNATEHYSGWSAMSTLIAKHYVQKVSSPAKYSLTDSGVALALSLIEGRAKHHHDFDDVNDEGDDNACGSKKKPQNNSKDMNKPKASSSMSSKSDFAKASTSGLGNLENRFSDSDDDDVSKQKYMKDFETHRATFKEPKPTAVNSDDELEAVLARSLTDTKSKKPFASSPSKSQSKSNAVFEDELEMTLALSLKESKMRNKVDFDDNNDEYLNDYNNDNSLNDFNDYNKIQKNSTANQKDEVDEDEEFKRALAISLNESKVKNDIDLDVHNDNFLSDSEEIKTNEIADQDAEMDEDLKTAFAMSMEEAKRREAYSNDSFDQMLGSEKRLENKFVSTNKSKEDAGPSSKKMDEEEIICLDDSDEDSFENVLKNYSEPKREDRNEDDNESYIEFCKENAESILYVKKKSEHFIFTEAPSDLNTTNGNSEKNAANVDKNYSTPEKYSGGINHDISNELLKSPDREIDNDWQSVPKSSNKKDNSKKLDSTDEIVIIDDDENVNCKVPAKTATSSPSNNTTKPTEVDKPNKTKSQPAANFQREKEVQKTNDPPSTSKNSNANPSKPPKSVKQNGNSQSNSQSKETPEDEPYDSFTLLPNNFDIVLLVDTQETSGVKKTKPEDDATMSALGDAGVLYEVRSLKVGDFAWIARCKFTQKELVLPYIIERKRLDDLGGSITDGRYHEQKHRLRQSGLSNVIYMIEHYGKTYHGALPLTSLFQAGMNTTVQDGFITKFTKDHKDSMSYLAILTRKLIRKYKSEELISCPKKYVASASQTSEGTKRLMEFSEFNKAALKTKQFTVREMLIKQLVQLKGISAEKAIGIAEMYPSPQLLAEAFKSKGKNLLSDIEVGSARRKVGPAISNVLHLFYTQTNLN